MARTLFILPFLLRLFCDVSCDGVKTIDTHVPDDIPAPKMTRDFPPCAEASSPQCLVVCSMSSVAQTQLSLFKGSASFSNLTISDLNNKSYLELEHQDKHDYSCVVSSSGSNQETTAMMSVSEGETDALPTILTQLQDKDDMMWFYRNPLISELFENGTAPHDCDDVGFSNRLQSDSKTGSLTITNISKTHPGGYKLLITNGPHQKCWSYNVIVYVPLPTIFFSNNSTKCSSSSNKTKCVVMCSVDMIDVTLSWYNGSTLLSKIYVHDLKKSNFLCLELDYHDNINNYSCVVTNSYIFFYSSRLDYNRLCNDHRLEKVIRIIILVVLLVLAVGICALCCYCNRRKQGASGAGNTTNERTYLITQPQ